MNAGRWIPRQQENYWNRILGKANYLKIYAHYKNVCSLFIGTKQNCHYWRLLPIKWTKEMATKVNQ